MKRRKVEEHVQVKFIPYVELTRESWTLWKIRVKARDNRGSNWENYYGDEIYYARGSEGHARAKAGRKLRKAVREHEWQSNIKRLDLE